MKPTHLVLVHCCLLLLSCKSRIFHASSGGMENTIMTGQKFFAAPAGTFKRNDVVVFNYYGNDYSAPEEEPGKFRQHWEKRVFRLIAYSGDTLEIIDGEVIINNRRVPLPPLAKEYYEVRSVVPIDEFDEQDSYMGIALQNGDTLTYLVNLTVEESKSYRLRKPGILSVRRKLAEPSLHDTVYARALAANGWDTDNYGPLRIPSPGESVIVNAGNYKLYKNIPGVQMGKNTIQEKLYFVLGDNRYAAEDSRYTGLVSHSNMYGIVKTK